jgi:hypothetical protein
MILNSTACQDYLEQISFGLNLLPFIQKLCDVSLSGTGGFVFITGDVMFTLKSLLVRCFSRTRLRVSIFINRCDILKVEI